MASCVDNLVMEGPYGRIEYAIRKDGTMPAQKGLNKLRNKKREKNKYFAFIALFEHYVNTGNLPSKYLDDYTHKSISGILKFKRHDSYPYRIPCFKETDKDNRIDNYILTHLFQKLEKDGGRQVKREIELADTIRTEHKERQSKKTKR